MSKVSAILAKGSAMSAAGSQLRFAAGWITEAVDGRRSGGLKAAFAEVARLVGFSERRVRALRSGEARQLLAEELVAIQRCQRQELQARLTRADAEAALLRVRLAQCDGQ